MAAQADTPASSRKRLLFAALGVLVGVALAGGGIAFDWFPGLAPQAICALGILSGCIVWWVFRVLPEAITAIVMVILLVTICQVPTQVALSTFASPTWWLLVAAFALGLGMQRSGLMRRMADAILRVFPRTFKMQAAGLMAAGTLIGPFIPSLSAKATLLAPLSLGISDSLGYERGGKQATGLFLAMFTGLRNIAPAVISASVIGYGLVATLPADVAAQFDMLHWFICMVPWLVFVVVVDYLAIVALYAPRKGKRGKAPTGESSGRPVLEGSRKPKAEAPCPAEPMTRQERWMAAIIACCIALWVTEPIHAIPSHVVALAAMVVMVASGVLPIKELREGLAWDSLIFIGCVLGLASVFAELGIDEWIVAAFQPAIEVLAVSPYLLIAGICAITVLSRFIVVSDMAFINIFMAFMVPLAFTLGINPWVIGVSVYAVVNPWFALYQNPIYLTAYYATEGKMVRQSAMAAFCPLYLLICVGGLMFSVPYWQWLGVL